MEFPHLKYWLSALAVTAGTLVTRAQNYGVYSHFYVDPFLYNPAEAASTSSWLMLDHRLQWRGVDGAPVLSTITYNSLLDKTRAGIGVRASFYQRGILQTTDLNLAYAYGVPLSTHTQLFFGLTGGFISNSINLENVDDPGDPVLGQYLANNFQPAASFGMALHTGAGINFGVALPQLIQPVYNSEGNFTNTKASPFDQVIASVYYRKELDPKDRRRRGPHPMEYEPVELYAQYKYDQLTSGQAEVLAKLNLSSNLWLAAGYRQSYGFVASAGLLVNKLLIGYAYELNNQPVTGFGPTHEFIVGVRLGKEKTFRTKAPVIHSLLTNAAEYRNPRFSGNQELPDNSVPSEKTTATRKYYVIAQAAFVDFNGADALKKKLLEQKFNAQIVYNEKDRRYYTYVFSTTRQAEANEEVKNLKTYTKLKNVRVLAITQ